MKQYLFLIIASIFSQTLFAQSETEQITNTLINYIEGTSYTKPNQIKKAFYTDANLYLDKKDEDVWIVPIKEYTSWFKKGKKGLFTGRIGNILSIGFSNGIATAKAEIIIASKGIKYIDMFLLKNINNQWKIISKTASSSKSNANGDRILFIVSNAHHYGDTKLATGNSYSEIVNAYDTFVKAGYTVDFVSPKGGSIPLAYINTSDDLQKHYLYNVNFMHALKHTKSPKEVSAKNYKAVHYIGGGSAMFGVPENKAIQKTVMSVYEDYNGIISSVCHGTAGIVHLKTKDGKYLVTGKAVNGYPDAFEHKDAAYFKQFPFLITKTIEERGGIFKYSPRNSIHIEEDGNLITGQNYLSSATVVKRIIERLKNK